MGLFSSRNRSAKIPKYWNNLNKASQLEKILEASMHKPQAIFKHSTTCGISASAKNRIEVIDVSDKIDIHYLDLLSFREVSNMVAEKLGVIHQSPQIIIIDKREVKISKSHFAIDLDLFKDLH